MTSFGDPGSGQSSSSETRDVMVNLGADVSGFSQGMSAAQQQATGLLGSVDRLSTSLGSLTQMAAHGIRWGNIAQRAGFDVATADAALLEHQLSTLRATSVVTGSSMNEMKDQIDSAFSKFPASRAEVIQLVETISNLGVTAPKAVGSMTETFLKLGGATGQDPNALASSNIQLDRMMGHTDPGQVAGYANSLLVLSKNQGVAVSGISDFAQAIAPMARAAGIGEASVLGISTAFAKAGADGSYAANTFNKIMGDITQMRATGDPGITQYSSFVGQSNAQFNKATPTDNFAAVFNQISKGGPEALSFMDSLGLGQRGLKAVQAVTQSGGLNAMIGQGQASSTNTTALDAASKAAYTGLSDSLIMTRNAFTKLGEVLGGPLLFAATKIADIFAWVVTMGTAVVKAMGPLPGILSNLASIVAGPLAFALSHFSILLTGAMLRTALGPNSMPRIAYAAGAEAGVAMRAGATRDEALAASSSGRRILAGTANWRTTLPFDMGQKAGYKPDYVADRYGAGPGGRVGQGIVGTYRTVVGGATYLADERIRTFRDARIVGDIRSGNVPKAPGATFREHVNAASMSNLARATGGMVVETAHGAGSMVTSAIGGTVRSVPLLSQASIQRDARIAGMKAATAVDTTGMNRADAKSARDAARIAANAASLSQTPLPLPQTSAATEVARLAANRTLQDVEHARVVAGGGSTAEARTASQVLAREQAIAHQNALPSTMPVSRFAPGVAATRLVTEDVGNLARGGGAIFKGASAVAGAIGSPLGMLATLIAVPAIGGLISHVKSQAADRANIQQTGGAVLYDQRLDRTSTNLAKFGSSVDAAGARLDSFASTPVADTTKVTPADVNAVQGSGYQVTDSDMKRVVDTAANTAKGKGGNEKDVGDAVKKGLLAYLDSMGIQAGDVNGQVTTQLKRDVLSTLGVNHTAQVEDIMGTFNKQVTTGGLNTNYDAGLLGQLAGSADSDAGKNQLRNFKGIFDVGQRGLRSATQPAGQAGNQAYMAGMLNMGAPATGTNNRGQAEKQTAFYSYLQNAFNIDPAEMSTAVARAGKDLKTEVPVAVKSDTGQFRDPAKVYSKVAFGNTTDAQRVYAHAIASTKSGQAWMTANGGIKEADLLKMIQRPQLPGPSETDTANKLNTAGAYDSPTRAIGQWMADPKQSKFMQAATGTDSGNLAAGWKQAQAAVGEASKVTGGNMSVVSATLMRLSDVMGGMKTPTGVLIKTAADWSAQLQTFNTATLSREGQLLSAKKQAAQDAAVVVDSQANGGTATKESIDTSKASDVAANTQTESYRQTMISQIVASKAFVLQQQRSRDDQKKQIDRSNRDFGQSQQRSDHDFGLQRQRSIDDFGQQQVRSIQDNTTQKMRAQFDFQEQSSRSLDAYHLQVSRQNEDHARDLKRQAQSAAQDIYDPYARIQIKSTTDAGTLIQNLTEQNGAIEKQMAQIAQLKKKGLSQGSIDTLKLTDSSNAQEVDALSLSFAQDPSAIKKVNALNASRLSATTRAVQNPASIAFRQEEQDYTQAQTRASADFAKAQGFAQKDYTKSVTRMADDFTKMSNRAAADQSKTLDRMSTDYSTTQDRAVKDHQKALDDMALDFKKFMQRAADDLATSFIQYDGLFTTVFDQLSGTALKSLEKYAPAAAKIIRDNLKIISDAYPNGLGAAVTLPPLPAAPTTPSMGEHSGGGGSSAPTTPTYTPPSSLPQGRRALAFGGITMTTQMAQVSEHGPELHLPLNSRGQDFMAGMITKSLVQGITAAISAPQVSSTSMTHDNSISFAGAEIKVVAQDPNKMARELAAKAKLKRLASPVRH